MCCLSAACCCLSSLCSAASCCGNSKMGARTARMVYAVLYFFAGMGALLLKYFGHKIYIDAINTGCIDPDDNTTSTGAVTISPLIPDEIGGWTVACAGNSAVYRMSLGLLSFYLLCGIVSMIIKAFHHGWWSIKIFLYIAALIYPFFLPEYSLQAYSQAARWFAGLFLIFQVLTYIACAYNMHEGIMEKSEEFTDMQSDDNAKCTCINYWTILYLFLCVAGVAGIVAGIVLMYMNFPCALPSVMTSITLVIAIVIVVLCLLSKFARGMLTGVVIACYTTYLCWSALTSNPDTTIVHDNGVNKSCNPFLCDPTDPDSTCDVGTMIVGILFTVVSISYTGYALGSTAANEDKREGDDDNEERKQKDKRLRKKKRKQSVDASETTDSQTPLARDLEKDGTMNKQAKLDQEEAARDDKEEDEEETEATCCGCGMNQRVRNGLFQLVMCLASFYLAMLFTNWATTEESKVAGVGTTSMWIKFVSQWFTVGIFLWTLVAPLCCPDRTFD